MGQDNILSNNYFSIYLDNDKKTKRIQLDNNRLMYTNEKFDITIIEIKDNGKHFQSNKEDGFNYLSDLYSNKSIYLINYPENKDVVVSYAQPPNFSESEIFHKCSTKKGSSGSPIL